MPLNPLTSTSSVLLTGATGFLGQAILERLLSLPEVPSITLLIRASTQEEGEARLAALASKEVFGPLKEALGSEAFAALWEEKVTLLRGDLSPALTVPAGLTHVVHSASLVSFDPPITQAFAANVEGPASLYRALKAASYEGPVVHVSTSYVQTGRVSKAKEEAVAHGHTWQFHLGEVKALEETIEAAPGSSKKKKARLEEAGQALASSLGFTDIYTTTKALGEQVAQDLWGQEHSLTIVRPTIIESALEVPYPGWIDGFKVADPLIAAYAQGLVNSFPGDDKNVVDIVPVDFVTSTTMAALTHPAPKGAPRYLQVGTSEVTPPHPGGVEGSGEALLL